MANYTKLQLSKKLLQVESVINTLGKTQCSKSEQQVVQQQIARLKQAKGKLATLLNEDAARIKSIRAKALQLRQQAIDLEQQASAEEEKDLQQDKVAIAETSTAENQLQQTAAIAKEVEQAIESAAKAKGDELVGLKVTMNKSLPTKFTAKLVYGHGRKTDKYEFELESGKILFIQNSDKTPIADYSVTDGNTPFINKEILKDAFIKLLTFGASEPSDDEYDQMAAMQAPTDPSQLNKNIAEDLDVGHQDNEPAMLKRDIYRIAKMASMLYKQLDNYDNGQEVDFPHWWQAKITKAYDYLQAAYGYLDGEEKVQQMDNTVVTAMSLNEKKGICCHECGHVHVLGSPHPTPNFTGKKNCKFNNTNEAAKPDYVDINKDGNKKESMKKAAQDAKLTKEQLKEVMLEAYVEVLQEQENAVLETSSDEILQKFDKVKKLLVSLFTQEYPEFVTDVKWLAPKPSTFGIDLKNGQSFTIKWMGKSKGKQTTTSNSSTEKQDKDYLNFQAQIEGKKYYLATTKEYQQALDKLNDIMKTGPITQGEEPGGEEFGAAPAEPAAGGGGGGEFPGGEGGGEAPAADFEGGAEPETPEAL